MVVVLRARNAIPILVFLIVSCLERIFRNTSEYNRLIVASQEALSNSFSPSQIATPTSAWWMTASLLTGSNNTTATNDDEEDDIKTPTMSQLISAGTTTTTKDYSDMYKYWKYDEAAPPIQYATTHQLRSLPLQNRLTPEAIQNLTAYVSKPENQYPQKLTMFETNPSIALLPTRYRVPIVVNDTTADNQHNMPVTPIYIASYRGIMANNNCFDSTSRGLMHGGGDWDLLKKIKDPGYVGLALLSENLAIVADVTVIMKHPKLKDKYRYSDYRLFTIHDELYLSTGITIGRLQLGLQSTQPVGDTRSSTTAAFVDYVQLSHFDEDNRQFEVYLHQQPSCPESKALVENSSKNLLYFVDSQNRTMVEYWPTGNPNQVRPIDFQKKCSLYHGTNAKNKEKRESHGAPISFPNFHAEHYPNRKDLFIPDRGSACCIRLEHPHTKKEYLVGVVHPKTPYPGKRLPKGMKPNIYLSRFFAMEPTAPYEIVSRTGSFCFGYSDETEIEGTILWNNSTKIMEMGNHTFNCPRIHFIMSIIDNHVNKSQVIISYGVSDCTSRFVMVNKVDIQAMLWPNDDSFS